MATELQVQRKKDRNERLSVAKGGEPTVTESNYKLDLMLALNWYNYNEDAIDFVKYGLDYLKKNHKEDFIKPFKAATASETRQISILMHLAVKGQYLSNDHKSLIASRLNTIKAKYATKDEPIDSKAIVAPVISVDMRVTEVARKHLAEINNEIDKFITSKTTDFSLKSYIAKNGLSGAVSKKIGEFYKPTLKELAEAIKGKDEDLNEGYAYLTKAQLKKFYTLVDSFVNDCSNQVLTAKANRAPRKRKEKPAGVQVAKMQYLQNYPELGLTSIPPSKIIGAQQLWVYNIRTKKLGAYYASGSSGFSVKGTSLQGWNPEVSNQNSLRKPAVTIEQVMSSGKPQLQKILGKLTTITTKLTGRFGPDTVLIRVL